MIKSTLSRSRHGHRQQFHYDSRGIHLLHAMFTKNHSERTMLAKIEKVELPSASDASLNLFDTMGHDLGTMTLSQALQQLEPRFHLSRSESLSGRYQIKSLSALKAVDPSSERKKGSPQFKRAGKAKEFHLTTGSEPGFLKWAVLSKAYEFLLRGARVEIQLHDPKRNEFSMRTILSALESNLHLRPDAILAAMPEGTIMLAEPCKLAIPGHGSLMWAMEHTSSLEAAGTSTPEIFKQLGTWKRKAEHGTRDEK